MLALWRQNKTMSKTKEMIQNFFPLLLDGDIQEIQSMFAGEPFLDEPVKGKVEGPDRFRHFLGNFRHWIQRRDPRVEHFATTATDHLIVEECLLHLAQSKELLQIPVAIAADLMEGKFSHVRIYHSLWPLFKEHTVRSPILPVKENVILPPLINAYMDALARGDTESILKLFEPDGYVREPAGDNYKQEGKDGLTAFYSSALADGGIPLGHCSSAYDGTCCAVEFIVDRWGKTQLSPQAGIAVYEQSSRGRLASVRIYDDVNSPIESR